VRSLRKTSEVSVKIRKRTCPGVRKEDPIDYSNAYSGIERMEIRSVRFRFERCSKENSEVVRAGLQRDVSIQNMAPYLPAPIPHFDVNPAGTRSIFSSDDRVLDAICYGAHRPRFSDALGAWVPG